MNAGRTPEQRLGDALASSRDALLDRLCELQWAADPADPSSLVQDPARVRARAALFLDTILEGLEKGEWAQFEATIGARTIDLLVAGVISARQLDDRALELTRLLIEPVLTKPDPGPLLMALFRTMQLLSGRIVSDYNERLLAESRQLDDLKTMFLRMTGHELRAPLGTIRGYASMLLDGDFGELGAQLREAALSIDRAAGSGLGILDRLSEVARLESRTEALQLSRHGLAEMVDVAVEPLRGAAVKLGVDLRVEAGEGQAALDSEEIAIAIRNLVGNALKYAAAGGEVVVSARLEGEEAVFEVADRGGGIPEPELPLVFDRYYRAARSRSGPLPGSGLGLYIVRRIAELHGGRVSAANRPGSGARFQLRIPADPAPPGAP